MPEESPESHESQRARGSISNREALAVLQDLVRGKDPRTGESLPADSCIQDARVLRSLLIAVRALEGGEADPELDALLGADFDSGMDISALMAKYQQDREAIATRLWKLGKTPDA
jgi:hypothetical protein